MSKPMQHHGKGWIHESRRHAAYFLSLVFVIQQSMLMPPALADDPPKSVSIIPSARIPNPIRELLLQSEVIGLKSVDHAKFETGDDAVAFTSIVKISGHGESEIKNELPIHASNAAGPVDLHNFHKTESENLKVRTLFDVSSNTVKKRILKQQGLNSSMFEMTLVTDKKYSQKVYQSESAGEIQSYTNDDESIAYFQVTNEDDSVQLKEWIYANHPNDQSGSRYLWSYSGAEGKSIQLRKNEDGTVTVFEQMEIGGVSANDHAKKRHVMDVVRQLFKDKASLQQSQELATLSPLVYWTASGDQKTADYEIREGSQLLIKIQEPASAYPLKIDPTLNFGQWAGSGSGSMPTVTSVAVDADEIYVGGHTSGGVFDESVTFQGTYSGGREGFVVEIADGTTPALNWGQWLGGSGDDYVLALVVSGNEIYAGGYSTDSTSWESVTFQGTHSGGQEGFVVEIGDASTPSLAWGQWLGGTGTDQVTCLAMDADEIYAGGYTNSTTSWESVTFQGSVTSTDGFVVEIADGSSPSLNWGQWFGGNNLDYIFGIAVTGDEIYIAGYSNGDTGLETVTTYGSAGGTEGFLVEIADGTTPALNWCQWLGGSGNNYIYAVAVNGEEIYVAGYATASDGWETVTFQGALSGEEGFVIEVSDGASPVLNWGQWLGGTGSDYVFAVAVTGDEIYATGYSTVDTTWESVTFQGTYSGGNEGFVVEIADGASPTLNWGQWLGGSNTDDLRGLAVNADEIYVGGITDSDGSFESVTFQGTGKSSYPGVYEGFAIEIADSTTPSLNWGQWLGGGNGSSQILAVAASGDEIYVGGWSGLSSSWESVTFQGTHSRGREGFVIEVADGATPSLNWGQWLGGVDADEVRSIAVNGDEIYAGGVTYNATSWESVTFQGTHSGSQEAFVVEIADGSTPTLNWGQWLGGSGSEQLYSVAVLGEEIYAAGSSTDSTSWESVTFQGTQSSTEGFVVEIQDGTTPSLNWGQWLGGTGTDSVRALAVEGDEIYAAGQSSSSTSWESVTFQGTLSGTEGFLVEIADGSTPALNWGQWIGGSGTDQILALAVNGDEIYVGGNSANSASWETVTFQGAQSGTEGFVVEVSDGTTPALNWGQWLGGTGSDFVYALEVSGDEIFAGGYSTVDTTWESVTFSGTYSGANEGYVVEIADGTSPTLVWGQWLGGAGNDQVWSMDLNGNELYVAGSSSSSSSWESVTFQGSFDGDTEEGFLLEAADGAKYSGTVYQTNESSPVTGSSKTVNLKVNGSGSSTAESSSSDGTWSIDDLTLANGDTVTIYLDGETEDATTVTVASAAADVSGISLIDDHIIIRADNAGSNINILDLVDYDSDQDADIRFDAEDAATDTLTVQDGDELYINSGDTFTPGGTVTVGTGGIDINGTWTATTTEQIFNAGSWDATGGTFTPASSTVMFNGASAVTLKSNGQSFNNLTLNDGLLGYWKFDETAANSCAGGTNDSCDSSGYGYDGLYSGTNIAPSTTVAALSFINPRSVVLNGSDDRIRISMFDLSNTNKVSVSVWVLRTAAVGSGTDQVIVEHSDNFLGTETGGFTLLTGHVSGSCSDNLVGVYLRGDVGYSGACYTPPALNTWHHYLAVYDKSQAGNNETNLYLDGVLQTPASRNNTSDNTNNFGSKPFNIGSRGGSSAFGSEKIDDLRVYNRVLSAAEIAILARGDEPGSAASSSSVTMQDALNVNGNLVLNSGELSNNTASDYSIDVGGSWINNGAKFTSDGGAVAFVAQAGAPVIQAGNQPFQTVQVNTSQTYLLWQDIRIDNDLVIAQGVLDTNAYDLVTVDDWDINAALDLDSGTHSVQGTVDLTGSTITAGTSTLLFNPSTAGETFTTASKILNNVAVSSTDGLVGWWKLDETAFNGCAGGQDSCDSSAQAIHCTETGGATISQNVAAVNFANNRAINFDGADDYLDCTSSAIYDNMSAMSVAFWIRPNSYGENTNGFIVTKSDGFESGWEIMLRGSLSTIELQVGYSTTNLIQRASFLSSDMNKWSHWVISWDGSSSAASVHVYKNGSEISSFVTSTNGSGSRVSDAAYSLMFGNNTSQNRSFDGPMDDVRMYNRVLTAQEIAALYRGHPLSATGTVTLQDTLDVNGHMILGDGTFAAGSNTIKVAKNWYNSAATFTYGTSTVDFDDDSQANTIYGDTTFYNFIISTATAKTATFESGKTTGIAASGTLTLTGASGQLLTLAPGTAATNWKLNVNATGTTQTVNYVRTTYSDASLGATITPGTGTADGSPIGTNINWNWGPTYSGTLYQSDETTALTGSAKTVNLKINGAGSYTAETNSGTGAWSIGGLTVAAGDTITIYLSGETEKANLVTITNGSSSVSSIPLIVDHVIVRADNGATATTIADMVDYDNDQNTTDMLFDADTGSPNTLSVEDGNELFIQSGKSFTPGGTVTVGTGGIDINGTWTATTTEQIFNAGSWDATGGTFTAASSTVMFNGASAVTLKSNAQSFNNLTLNDGLVGYWKLDETSGSTAADVSGYGNHAAWNGSVTASTNVPNLAFSNPRALHFNGANNYLNGGSDLIDTGDRTLIFWVYPESIATGYYLFTNGKFIVQFVGSDQIRVTNNNFSTIINSNSDLSVNAWFSVAVVRKSTGLTSIYVNGALSGSADRDAGAPVSGTSNFFAGNSFDGLLGVLDDVRIYNRVLGISEIIAFARGDQSAAAASGSSVTIQDALDVNGNLVLNSGNLDTKSGSNYSINVAGNWENNGAIFTSRSGTVTLDATSGTKTVLAGNQTFNVLTVNGSGGTFQLNQSVMTSGNMNHSAGTLNTNGYDLVDTGDLTVAAPVDLSSGTHSVQGSVNLTGATVTGGTSTLLLNPSTAGKTFTAANKTLNNVAVSSTDGLVGWWKLDETALNSCSGGVKDACDSSGQGNDGSESGGVTISSNTAPVSFANARSFSLDGSNDYVSIPDASSLHPALVTVSLWVNSQDNVPLSYLLFKDKSSGASFYLQNNNSGNLKFCTTGDICATASNAALYKKWAHVAAGYDGTNAFLYINGALANQNAANAINYTSPLALYIGYSSNFPNAMIDDVRMYNRVLTAQEIAALYRGHSLSATGTVTLQDTLDVNGHMVLGDGTFAAGAQLIKVAKNWYNSAATFTYGTSTVDFDDDTQANTIYGDTTFYNFTISTATAKTATFESTKTTGIAASGTLTLTGSSGQLLTLAPGTAATAWKLNVNASGTTQSISYVSPTYSDASLGAAITPGTGAVDGSPGGTNTNWTFGLSVSGTAYQSNESSAITGSAKTVNLKVNGSGSYTAETNTGDGTWTINNVVASAGDTLTIYLNAETEKANVVTITDGTTNISGIALIADHVILRSDRGSNAITILDLLDYDNDQNSTDMLFDAEDATPDTLSVEDGNELYINATDTFTPGGTVTVGTGGIDINGTWTATTTEQIFNAGSWDATGGTFTAASSTVMFNGTSAVTLTANAQSFNNLTLNDGLVGYWKFDETAADSCTGGANDSCDASGYQLDGSWVGNTSASSTVPSLQFATPRSITLDGSGDYVSVGNPAKIQVGGANFAVSVWFKSNSWAGSYNSVFDKGTGTSNRDYCFFIDSDTTGWWAAGNAGGAGWSSTGFSSGVWHHLAMTRSSNVCYAYLDGVFKFQDSCAGATDSGGNLQIGGNPSTGGSAFDGLIDDFRIYNRAMTASEAAALARGDQPRTAASGSTVTLNSSITVDGNLVLNSGNLIENIANIYVGRSLYNHGGIYTHSSGTGALNFYGSVGGSILPGASHFYDFKITGTGSWVLLGDAVAEDDFAITDAGTLDTNGYDIVTTDDWNINGTNATLDLDSGTHSVQGSVNLTGSIITAGTSTLLLNPSTAGETFTTASKILNNVAVSSTDGLVGWWKLDETVSGSFADSSSGAHAATGRGASGTNNTPQPSVIAAPLNYSNVRGASFDGTDDDIQLSASPLSDYSEGSVSLWAYLPKWDDSVGYTAFVLYVDTSNYISFPKSDTNNVLYRYSAGGTFLQGTKSATGVAPGWHLLTMAWSKSKNEFRYYFDGASAGSPITGLGTWSGTPSTYMFIGRSTTTGYWAGYIDDVRVYNRPLIAEEIAALYRGHPLSATGTVTLQDTLDVNGHMILGDGTFAAGAQLIKVAKNWYNSAATFTYGTSTVDFDDDSQANTIYGDTTFYNFTISTATAKTATFESGKTTGIAASGTLTLTGASGQLLTLAPGTAATNWKLNVNASGTTQSISYVSPTYSDASLGAMINATSATNVDGSPGLTNTNWDFAGIPVSGTAYANNETTPLTGSSRNVALRVNGGSPVTTTTNSSTGAFVFTSVTASAGDTLTIYFYGAADGTAGTETGNTILITDGTTSLTGVKLIDDHVLIRSDNGATATTIVDLTDYDNDQNAANLLFDAEDAAPDTLSVEDGNELYIESGELFTPGGNADVGTGGIDIRGTWTATTTETINNAGSWNNAGTFTPASSVVTFDSTTSGNILTGTMNGSSTTNNFYKVNFNGSGGAWTIQDAMRVSAANATDTFVIGNGTVTLGNGNGDNLEVDGKMTIANTANQTGTFQTYANAEGSSITFDMNANSSTPSCANCIITVGATSGSGQGNLKIRKNTILRLNPRSSATASDTGIEVESTGYLEIQGTQDYTGTSDGTTDETTLTDSTKTWTGSENNNKVLRMTSGLAIGMIYPITGTTATTLTRADTSSADATMTVTGSGPTRKICSSVNTLITANDQEIGRYIHDKTGTTGYVKVIDSVNNDATCSGSADSFTVIAEPGAFAILTNTDSFDISDAIQQNDTYEILDYAQVTAEAGTACNATVNQSGEAYIYSKTDSQVVLQYADICNLGRNVVNKYGMYLDGLDGGGSLEGVSLSNSRLRSNYYGVILINSPNNTLSSNAMYSNAIVGVGVDASANNTVVTASRFYSNSPGYGVYIGNGNSGSIISFNYFYLNIYGILTFGPTSRNSVISNVFYTNSSGGLTLSTSPSSLVESNIDIGETLVVSDCANTVVKSNTVYGNSAGAGISVGTANNVTVLNNTAYANATGLKLDFSDYVIALGNSFYSNTTEGVWVRASNDRLIGNSIYQNGYGLTLDKNAALTGNISINENYGGSGANTTSDIFFTNTGAHKFRMLNATLASSTEVSGVTVANAYILSQKHDGASGVTNLWGDYSFPTNSTETPQDETTDKYNYTDNLWEKSASAHGYYGTGTEDSNLNYDLSTSDLSAGPYAYRASYNGTNWDVTRNGTSVGTASTNSQFTDSNASVNVKFKIDSGGVAYVTGDTYTFAVWDASGDTSTQKTVTLQQNGDSVTIGNTQTMQMTGQSAGTNLSTLAVLTPASMAYDLTVNSGGTLSGNYNTVTVTGNVNGNGGTINLGAGSTLIQRATANKSFGTTAGAANWTFQDLNFENGNTAPSPPLTITTGNGGTGQIITNGTLTIGKAADSYNTTLDNETRDRIIDANDAVTITSKGVLTASSTASFTVGGDWSNDGTFTSGTGTVTFNKASGTQIINDNNSWYGLAVTGSAARTVQFESAKTQTIAASGSFTLTGASGQLLSLSPLTAATAWNLNVNASASQSITYVSPTYSDASFGASINAYDGTSVDGSPNGTNTNWFFTAPISISGVSDSTGTVKVAYNGTLKASSAAIGGGIFSITGIAAPATNDIVTVFIDGAADADESTAVTKYDGSGNISGLVLNRHVLSIGSADNQSLTLTNLGQHDQDQDEDIMHSSNSGTLLVDAGSSYSDEKIDVLSGNTLSVGAETVTTLDLTITGSLTSTAASTYNVAGNFAQNGTFTPSTSTVNFTSTSSGKTLTGTMNGAAATNNFYKVNFSGSGGAWTIQDAMRVTADAADTFVVGNGTVTLGNGNGDNLEVLGKMKIANAGETGTFQTMSGLAQGSEIILDINKNQVSPPACTNCGITVGGATGSGTFILNKNAVLRLNPRSDANTTDVGLEVESTGYLQILGTMDQTGASDTAGTGTSETLLCLSDGSESYTGSQHNNKVVRMTSGLAFGKIYDITATTAADGSCSASVSSITRATTASSGTTISNTSDNVTIRTVTLAGSIAASTDVGRYLKDTTNSNKYYKIISYTSATSINVIPEPDTYSGMANGDSVVIVDGVRSADTYEIYDYASARAESDTCAATNDEAAKGEAYLYAKSGSQSLIRYADLCDLGRDTANKYGASFDSVNGANANEGVTVEKSRTRAGYYGIVLTGSSNNTLSSNSIFGNLGLGIWIDSSSHSTLNSNAIFGNIGQGISLTLTSNIVLSSNVVFGNSGAGLFLGASNSTISSNAFFGNSSLGVWQVGVSNSTFSSNLIFGNTNNGMSFSGSNNTLSSNSSFGNTGYGIWFGSNSSNNTLNSNSSFGNTSYGLYFTGTCTGNRSIQDNYGGLGANATADIGSNATANKILLYNTTLASIAEVSGFTTANAYVTSFKHDGSNGVTKIWGDYVVPDAVAETPQAEETEKYNYADPLWVDSVTPHGYSGTGTNDTDLQFSFSGAMGGDGSAYTYRVVCNAADCVATGNSWDVYRNEALLTAKATTGAQYTDSQNDGASAPNVRFTIGDAGTNYVSGDTYTFVAFKTSNDASVQKTVTLQQNNDSIVIGSGEAMQFNGQSAGTNLSTLAVLTPGSMAYDLTVNSGGTLSGSNNAFTVTGNVNGSGGTINLGSGSSFIQRVFAAQNFGTTSGATSWTFQDLNFENASGAGRTITTGNGGTGQIITNGILTVGKAADSFATTLDNETRDRIIDANGAVSITSKGVLQASSTASFTVGDNWTNAGTFTSGTGTVTMDAGSTGKTITVGGSNFNNLIFNNASGGWTLQDTATVASVLTITAGDFSAGSQTLTLSGTSGTPFAVSGTFTPANSTVIYTGNNAGGNTTVKNLTYNNLTLNNGSETYVLAGTTTTNGNLYIQAGTLDTTGSNHALNVKGNWTRTGTFTPNAATVTFNGTGAQTINSDNTWYGLAITGTSARTVSFESTKTQTIAANGTITWAGASGQMLTLAPLTPSTSWNLNVNATGVTQSITYVDVSYSDASSGAEVNACGGNNNDGGNNPNWNFCADTGMFFQFF